MNKVDKIFEEIDEIYSEWHGGELHIGTERTERIKEVLTQQLILHGVVCSATYGFKLGKRIIDIKAKSEKKALAILNEKHFELISGANKIELLGELQ